MSTEPVSDSDQAPERSHGWTSFSLRTLFILTTLCCLAVGAWAVYVNPFRAEAQSLTEVKRLQGEFEVKPAEGPGWQRWLVTTFNGKDAFAHVTKVDLSGRKVDDATLRALAGLTHLQELKLDYTPVTDAGAANLKTMRELRRLSLRYTGIADKSAEHLAALPNLEIVHLTGAKMTDAAVEKLGQHPAMKEIYIRWTQITNDGAARLAKALPNCAVHHHALTPN